MKKYFWTIAALFYCALTISLVSCSKDDAESIIAPPVSGQGFFSTEINALIDENYKTIERQGYGELVIPASMFDHTPFAIPADAAGDMGYVIRAGFKAYVNGGSVRDAVMGIAPNDVDFSTDATPEQLQQLVPNTQIYTAPSGYVVAQAWHGDDRTDMATMRAIYPILHGKPGIPESQYEGPYGKSLLEDTYTRDLTINSLYYDYQTGNIYDFHGGLHDLREGIIRTLFDPELALSVDPTRILRAVRFAGRFGFKIDEATSKSMHKNIASCDGIDAHGKAYTLNSCFKDGAMARSYRVMKEYDILGRYFLTLKDVLNSQAYNDYINKVYTYLDDQKCKNIPTNMAALFYPVMQQEIGKKEPAASEVLAAWNTLEERSGQKETYEIEDSFKTAMCQLWYLLGQMTSSNVTGDASKAAAVRADKSYAQAQLLLQAMAQADSNLKQFADFWR